MNLINLKFRLVRAQFAILMLGMLLQRSPAIRLLASLEKALSQPISQAIRMTTWVATAMGVFHATAGATQFNTAPGNSPFNVEVGEELVFSFTVTGAPKIPARWVIQGAVAPGLTMTSDTEGTLVDGQIGGNVITVRGEPNTPGIFVFNAQAFNDVGQTDNNKYEVQVNVTAIAPEILRDPVSTRVSTGGRAQFFFESSGLVESIQWFRDGMELVGETGSTLVIQDVAPSDEGVYTVEVSNSAGSLLSEGGSLTIDDEATADLVNLATRGLVGNGNDIMIGGLTVLGGSTKTVLVRGLGPQLDDDGVPGALVDPELKVFQTIFVEPFGSQLLVTNDDWEVGPNAAELATALEDLGKPLLAGSKDAALLLTLNQGVYTFQLSGVGGEEGVGLIELFVVD